MSLEALLTRLADSLDRNSAAMEALNKKAGGSAPAAADKPATASKPAANKPAAGKASGGKAKALTVDDIAEAFGGYLKGGDADARAEAKDNVKAILNHFGVERASHIDPSDFAEAMKFLKQFQAGETPDFMNDGGDEDGGDDGEDLM